MKIHTVGWYGCNNLGDESYKLSFPILFPEHSFTFSQKLVPADAYIVGGGDVVHGRYLKLLQSEKNKHIMSATLSNVVDIKDYKSIALRDLRSMEFSKKCGVKAELIPDFAFAFTSNAARGKQLIDQIFAAEGQERYERVIATTINGFLLPSHNTLDRESQHFHNLSYELSHAIDFTSASFIFLPFGSEMPTDDRIANMWISSKCKFHKKNLCVLNRLSVQDTLDIMAASDAVVSTRLHSSIFSCVAGVPFIDITHNHKNESFLETIGYKNSIPYRGFSSIKFLEMISSILSDSKQTRKELCAITDNYKNKLLDYSNSLKNVLNCER